MFHRFWSQISVKLNKENQFQRLHKRKIHTNNIISSKSDATKFQLLFKKSLKNSFYEVLTLTNEKKVLGKKLLMKLPKKMNIITIIRICN